MRPQELNLLVIFNAVMTERSISRAAQRLSMTQPAVSNAVSRMRVAWKDELFVKSGRNIKPTLKATNMWEQIRVPINELSMVIRPSEFDLATSNRTFKIAASDIVVQMMIVPLRQYIECHAPNINIHMVPYTIVNTTQVLDDATVDLVIGTGNSESTNIRAEHLFQPHYICTMRPDHPLAKRNLSLQEFAEAQHLFVSLSGDVVGSTDEALAQEGLSRRIALSVNQFSMIAPILVNSDLICVAPLSAVAPAIISGEITGTLPPVDLSPPSANLHWHLRQDKDPGLKWLREQIRNIIKEAESRNISETMPKLCCTSKELCQKLKLSI